MNGFKIAFSFRRISPLLFPAILACSFPAEAVVVWNESSRDDLSNTKLSPTNLLVLASGDNIVTGTKGPGVGSDTRDCAFFVVPQGQSLSQVILQDYSGGSYVSLTLFPGATPNFSISEIEFINWAGFSNGIDLLQFDSAPGSQPAGTYSFNLEFIQMDPGEAYTINFRLTPVPEPGATILAGAGGALALLRRRRRGQVTGRR